MSQMHEFKLRVYYRDTDAIGVVYHPNFLAFAESARLEYLRSLEMTQAYIRETLHCRFVVRHCEVGYHASALLEEELTVLTRVESVKNTSITFNQLINNEEKLLASLKIVAVCINSEGRPMRIPEELLSAIEKR